MSFFLDLFDSKISVTVNLYCGLGGIALFTINIKDSANFPINDLRSTSLIVKTLSAIWACFFLRAALNLIAHYWCFVYATYWSLCYQILIVDYFNTLRLSLSFNAQKNTSRSKGFSVSVMLQSLPATRHKQTPDFVIIEAS